MGLSVAAAVRKSSNRVHQGKVFRSNVDVVITRDDAARARAQAQAAPLGASTSSRVQAHAISTASRKRFYMLPDVHAMQSVWP